MNKWIEGESLEIIKQEISRANTTLKNVLGVHCKGICAPKGEDPDLNIMKAFFEYALKKGVVFLGHLDFFEMIRKEKEQSEYSLC